MKSLKLNNFQVKKITYQETKHWILNIHYAKRMPCVSHAFGVFDGDAMIGVCTFGIPASPTLCRGVCGEEYKSIVLELNRLVIHPDAPRNTASYLIGKAIKLLPKPSILVSYADTQMTHVGYVYQATNWIYTGATKPRTDAYAGDGKHSRHHKGDLAIRQYRSAKHRYVYFNGIKLLDKLKYNVLPYPKGNVQKYNIDKSLFQDKAALADEQGTTEGKGSTEKQ